MIILLLEGCSGSKINMLAEFGIQYRVCIKSFGIDDPFFDDIAGALSCYTVAGDTIRIIDRGHTGPVHIVQVLPVDLAVIDIILHQVIQLLSL